MKPLITLSSDFGPGNIGCGAMEAIIYEICPEAKVVHLCHAIQGYNIKEGARSLEGVQKLPVGFHVCVVDPGVGTKRRGIAIQTKRGDFLIGPDNGLLRPATEFLGGVSQVFELTNERYQRKPVSPIFHGRDVFAPAAAYLASGVNPEEFGAPVNPKELVGPPYPEAKWNGDEINCEVIHINENGSCFLNVRSEEFSKSLEWGECVEILPFPVPAGAPPNSWRAGRHLLVSFCKTFGDVAKGEPIILEDDFGRVELGLNQGNFAFTFQVKRGQALIIKKESS